MAKCLVLGANGFIGSHLVDELVSNNHTVRAFGYFKSNQILFKSSDSIEIFKGDFLNHHDLSTALDNIDYVFHFISTTTPASADDEPMIDIETNVRMSIKLLQLCVEKKIKKVFFASTGGAIYGLNKSSVAYKETDTPQPVSPYAIGKLTIEHYLRYFKVKNGLDSVSLRISNPYGERQPFRRKQGVIPIFIEKIINNEPITIFGDGSMVRDYIYVKDVARAISSMIAKPTLFDVYNVGSSEGVSILKLVSVIETVTKKKAQISHLDTPLTYVGKVILDTGSYKDEFGELKCISLAEGIEKTYNYILSSSEAEITA